jgi:hypothetical protein
VSDVVKTVASKAIKGERAKAVKKRKKGRDAMDGCSFGGRNKKQGVSKGGLRQTITTTADSPFSTHPLV